MSSIKHRLTGRQPVASWGELGADRVHIIGIAGSGLRGMAVIFSQMGIQVSGSELSRSPILDSLQMRGVICSVGHRKENLPPGTGLVLISAAIQSDNPELKEANRLGLPVLKYSELLGSLMRERLGIAIAGTHGKTTTTAMAVQVLQEAGVDPSFLIGGEYPKVGGSAAWRDSSFFVAEACEFDRSFLNLFPKYAIITNVEEDHLDYFDSLSEIQEAFGEFAQHLPKDGFLVLNGDDPNSQILANKTFAEVGWFHLDRQAGCQRADWWAEKVRPESGGVAFQAVCRDGERLDLALKVPGTHNVKNALAVLVLMKRLGISLSGAAQSLGRFTGVRRRFDILMRHPALVIDDYAHHPTEIEMVLQAARESFPGRRLQVVFQPHQYSRTYRFLYGFARALAAADHAMITDVYAARDSEEDRKRISSANLVDAIRQVDGNAMHLSSYEDAVETIRRSVAPGDVLLFLGAGDITQLAHNAVQAISGEDPAGGLDAVGSASVLQSAMPGAFSSSLDLHQVVGGYA